MTSNNESKVKISGLKFKKTSGVETWVLCEADVKLYISTVSKNK